MRRAWWMLCGCSDGRRTYLNTEGARGLCSLTDPAGRMLRLQLYISCRLGPYKVHQRHKNLTGRGRGIYLPISPQIGRSSLRRLCKHDIVMTSTLPAKPRITCRGTIKTLRFCICRTSNEQNRAKPCTGVFTFGSGLSVHPTLPFINSGATMTLEAFAYPMASMKDSAEAIIWKRC